jgi:transposase
MSMRGRFEDQGGLFSYVEPESRIPARHPLRQVRALVREVLTELSWSLGKLYSHQGRPADSDDGAHLFRTIDAHAFR